MNYALEYFLLVFTVAISAKISNVTVYVANAKEPLCQQHHGNVQDVLHITALTTVHITITGGKSCPVFIMKSARTVGKVIRNFLLYAIYVVPINTTVIITVSMEKIKQNQEIYVTLAWLVMMGDLNVVSANARQKIIATKRNHPICCIVSTNVHTTGLKLPALTANNKMIWTFGSVEDVRKAKMLTVVTNACSGHGIKYVKNV